MFLCRLEMASKELLDFLNQEAARDEARALALAENEKLEVCVFSFVLVKFSHFLCIFIHVSLITACKFS